MQKAREEAKEILSDAKEEATSVINELNSLGKNDLAKANNLRNKLNEKLKDVSANDSNTLNLDALKALNNKFSLKNNTLDNKKKNNNKNTSHSSVTFSKGNQFKSQNISSETNVIGMNVDEAVFVIDKYLDDCAIAQLSPIRIVHGKGTGKLREGIHKFLKTNPHVASFRLGTFGEGEMGVTVVELK